MGCAQVPSQACSQVSSKRTAWQRGQGLTLPASPSHSLGSACLHPAPSPPPAPGASSNLLSGVCSRARGRAQQVPCAHPGATSPARTSCSRNGVLLLKTHIQCLRLVFPSFPCWLKYLGSILGGFNGYSPATSEPRKGTKKKQVIKQNVVKTPRERAVCQLSDKQMNAANL